MDQLREQQRERAYRFDLMIATDWCERFDMVVAEHVTLPDKGHLLEINCGTGSRVLALAAGLKEGDVTGTDADPERIAIAQAKAMAATSESNFIVGDPEQLELESDSFDAVVLDASLSEPSRLPAMLGEAVRVARKGAPVVLKSTLRGSFDEFFSLYWEALHDLGLDDAVWTKLEELITRRPTLSEVVATMRSAGVKSASPHRSKEEWRFTSGKEFLTSPLVSDLFLAEWAAILPPERQSDAMRNVVQLIDREVDGHYFDVSVSAVVLAGHK